MRLDTTARKLKVPIRIVKEIIVTAKGPTDTANFRDKIMTKQQMNIKEDKILKKKKKYFSLFVQTSIAVIDLKKDAFLSIRKEKL